MSLTQDADRLATGFGPFSYKKTTQILTSVNDQDDDLDSDDDDCIPGKVDMDQNSMNCWIESFDQIPSDSDKEMSDENRYSSDGEQGIEKENDVCYQQIFPAFKNLCTLCQETYLFRRLQQLKRGLE